MNTYAKWFSRVTWLGIIVCEYVLCHSLMLFSRANAVVFKDAPT